MLRAQRATLDLELRDENLFQKLLAISVLYLGCRVFFRAGEKFIHGKFEGRYRHCNLLGKILRVMEGSTIVSRPRSTCIIGLRMVILKLPMCKIKKSRVNIYSPTATMTFERK